MNPALHRSITFWSGILAIAFIGWAWWMSLSHGSWCRWNCFSAGNICGGVEINSAYSGSGFSAWRTGNPSKWTTPVMTAPFLLRGTGSPDSHVENGLPVTYRESLEMMMARRDRQAWLIFIPHWLTLLAVVLPWTALLFWRSRRGRGLLLQLGR